LFRVTPVTETGLTVTSQVAFLDPSFVVTVMVAVPTLTAVTVPVEDTLATEVLLEDQVTVLSEAFSGVTVGVKVSDSPILSDREVLFKLTPVTETGFTVTEQVAVLLPSFVLTVMVAVPTALAVTTPEDETVAIEELLVLQVTDLSVALDGLTVAVRV